MLPRCTAISYRLYKLYIVFYYVAIYKCRPTGHLLWAAKTAIEKKWTQQWTLFVFMCSTIMRNQGNSYKGLSSKRRCHLLATYILYKPASLPRTVSQLGLRNPSVWPKYSLVSVIYSIFKERVFFFIYSCILFSPFYQNERERGSLWTQQTIRRLSVSGIHPPGAIAAIDSATATAAAQCASRLLPEFFCFCLSEAGLSHRRGSALPSTARRIQTPTEFSLIFRLFHFTKWSSSIIYTRPTSSYIHILHSIYCFQNVI